MFAVLLLLAIGGEQSQQVIPIDSIWSFGIRGTRDINSPENKPTVFAIADKLINHKRTDVAGSIPLVKSHNALKNFLAELNKPDLARRSFTEDTELTAVFYTWACGYYVKFEQLSWEGHTLTIKYHFIDHMTADAAYHFALIPLGKLPPGKYVIKVLPNKPKEPIIDGRRNPIADVCNDTTFYITGAAQ